MDTKKDIFDLVSEGYMEEVKENKEPSYDEMVAMGMPTELVGMQWGENTLSKIQDDWKRDNGFLSEEKEKTNPSLEEVEENKEPDLEE